MNKFDINYRPVKREAICRGCDRAIPKGEYAITTYSFRNRGQNIYFCEPCVNTMNELIREHNNGKL